MKQPSRGHSAAEPRIVGSERVKSGEAQHLHTFAVCEEGDTIFAGQNMNLCTFVCAITTAFFPPRRLRIRDAYIGHIEVEQVEQQPILGWKRGFWAGFRAPLQ